MAQMSRKSDNTDEPRAWALRDRTRVAPQAVFARNMRGAPTEAEKKLWRHLHRLSLDGSHFRRQVQLGQYIVDFVGHKMHIEIDGGQHAENAADAARTKFIESQGYRVLRFWNNDVLSNVDGVLEVIQATVNELQALHPLRKGAAASQDAASPFPLVGEGRGGGSGGCGPIVLHTPTPTPTPDPSPQGGGEQKGSVA
jgi:very-short-patch-repair endonuclease